MDEGDFYEEDESLEERKKAWREGEPAVTKGSRDLNHRAKGIVDRVVERWENDAGRAFFVADTGTANESPPMAPETSGGVGTTTVYEVSEYSPS